MPIDALNTRAPFPKPLARLVERMTGKRGHSRPVPAPHLRPLAQLVGTWRIRGRTPDSKVDNIRGVVRFVWSDDMTFLESRGVLRVGKLEARALEIMTYAGAPGAFLGWVFSSYSTGKAKPARYHWSIKGSRVRHSGLGATFRGSFSPDGRILSGGWHPDPGRKRLSGSRYDAVMTRVSRR